MTTWKPDPQTYDQALHEIGCLEAEVTELREQLEEARRIFPAYFERMSCVQDTLGPGSYFWPGAKEGDERISLRALPENAGDYESEPEIQCGLFCEMAERDMQEAA